MVSPPSASGPNGHLARFLEASASWLLAPAAAAPSAAPEDDVPAAPSVEGLEVRDSSWAEWDSACARWEQAPKRL